MGLRPRRHVRIAARDVRSGTVWTAAALIAILLAGGALRLARADLPRHRLSTDERAYVHLGADLRARGAYGDLSLRQPLRWAPGAPALFAVATAIAGQGPQEVGQRGDESPARVAQVVAGTATIALCFAIAALLAGALAGLVAALAVALWPPGIAIASTFLSEPVGAATLALAALALVWALRRTGPRRAALAGAALGMACLARADVLAAALVLPVVVALLHRRDAGTRAGLAAGAAMLLATLAVIAPWAVYASGRSGHFVPVTDGSAGTLFVATYLPGGGSLFGAKRALARETCRRYPIQCRRGADAAPAQYTLDAVAARRPHVGHDAALRAAVGENLRRYALGHPVAFARMLADKTWRMWGFTWRGRTRLAAGPSVLWVHRVLAGLALAGLLAGIVRARSRALLALLAGLLALTAINVVFVAEARHNLRLMPLLLAAGAAGWALVLRAYPRGPRALSRPGAPVPGPPVAPAA